MNDTNSFFIELSALFDPKGFEEAESKLSQTESSFNDYFKNIEENASAFSNIFAEYSSKASKSSLNAFGDFFDVTSKNFLDIDNLAKQVFSSVANNAFAALSNFAVNGLLGGALGSGSLFGGILGSRRSGGAINKTGTYYLHEGEFVLPPEIVAGIQNTPQSNQNNGQESIINIKKRAI